MELLKAYIQQMKVENPEEYNKLVAAYETEGEMIDHITILTDKAVKFHENE